MARPVRRILDQLDAKPPQIDWAELDATSEDDIERHAAEDGDPPGGYEPRPFPDLKALRARFGMSQDTFAGAIGVPARTIRNWEQGRTYPDPAAITAAADHRRRTRRGIRRPGSEVGCRAAQVWAVEKGSLAARLKTGVPGGIRTHGPRIRNLRSVIAIRCRYDHRVLF
jgi:putative transcriptional regulator